MSDIFGGLLLAGIVAGALLDDGSVWSDDVGKRFAEASERIINGAHSGAEQAANAVSRNASELKDEVDGYSKEAIDHIHSCTSAAKDICRAANALQPKNLYDRSRQLYEQTYNSLSGAEKG